MWATRLLVAGMLACAAFLAGSLLILGGIRFFYSGSALPGVYVGDVDVSGLSAAEIQVALAGRLTYPSTGRLALRDGPAVWTASPGEVGAVLDAPSMATEALAVGRTGDPLDELGAQLDAWFRGVVVPPILLFDERAAAAYLDGLAATIDRPTVEAGALINGREVQVTAGQIGRQLDVETSLARLATATAGMTDAVIDLPVRETPPAILDASAQAEVARQLLSQPFSLTADGAGPWVFPPEKLAEMIRFRRVEDGGTPQLVVGLDEAVLIPMLTDLAPSLEQTPANARFIFNDDTRQLDLIRSAVIGRTLDVPASLDAIQQAAGRAQHEVPLVFETQAPAVGNDATAAQLGITENVLMASY
ncbi:MAG TPA: peptidoglycan binding domain-containing protein, partial [Anaerolineales bacterium]|nr:peptidoglycan binding domain-containing protein [Anaerolineales bacterium]